jgi:uncharacterized protein YciI
VPPKGSSRDQGPELGDEQEHHQERSGPGRVLPISFFVFRLIAPRPDFALTMSDEEREVMGRHAAYWQPYLDAGKMAVFGPVLDGTGSWGLGVVEAVDEEEAVLREFAAGDPAITTGTAQVEFGKMLAGFVRPKS